MPDAPHLHYNMTKLPRGTTMHVTIHLTRRIMVRYWIAVRLFYLAALVLGCGIEIENEDEERT